VSAPGAGFGTDTNIVHFIDAHGTTTPAQGTKRQVAARMWDLVAKKLGAS
jgi:phosphopantothenoylcysteine synthetase/decarboxylase